jgi:hypothetical protein
MVSLRRLIIVCRQIYYHSDHLGSTTYLTDRNGNITQTLAYLPCGEDWVDITARTTAFQREKTLRP